MGWGDNLKKQDTPPLSTTEKTQETTGIPTSLSQETFFLDIGEALREAQREASNSTGFVKKLYVNVTQAQLDTLEKMGCNDLASAVRLRLDTLSILEGMYS